MLAVLAPRTKRENDINDARENPAPKTVIQDDETYFTPREHRKHTNEGGEANSSNRTQRKNTYCQIKETSHRVIVYFKGLEYPELLNTDVGFWCEEFAGWKLNRF